MLAHADLYEAPLGINAHNMQSCFYGMLPLDGSGERINLIECCVWLL
jgi:hypothetical protein